MTTEAGPTASNVSGDFLPGTGSDVSTIGPAPLLNVTVNDKATGRHKPRPGSALCDSGCVQSGNESLVKS